MCKESETSDTYFFTNVGELGTCVITFDADNAYLFIALLINVRLSFSLITVCLSQVGSDRSVYPVRASPFHLEPPVGSQAGDILMRGVCYCDTNPLEVLDRFYTNPMIFTVDPQVLRGSKSILNPTATLNNLIWDFSRPPSYSSQCFFPRDYKQHFYSTQTLGATVD